MKQPKPWYRMSKKSWYVEIDGKQLLLGRHPETLALPERSKKTKQWNPPPAILQAFYAKIAELKECPKDPPSSQSPPLTVAGVCDRFLEFSNQHNEPSTYTWYKGYLDDFCNHHDEHSRAIGHLSAIELKPFHVTRWLDSQPGWKTSRSCAIRAIKRAFCWADTEAILTPNPIAAVAIRRFLVLDWDWNEERG